MAKKRVKNQTDLEKAATVARGTGRAVAKTAKAAGKGFGLLGRGIAATAKATKRAGGKAVDSYCVASGERECRRNYRRATKKKR